MLTEKNKSNQNSGAQTGQVNTNEATSWTLKDYGAAFIKSAVALGTGYFGLSYLSTLLQGAEGQVDFVPADNGANDAGVNLDSPPSITNLPHLGAGSRKLLSTNITVINPVPDIQFEASVEDQYFLDGNVIFSGDIATISVLSTGNAPLPNWLSFQYIALGNTNTPGLAQAIVVQANTAYVADDTSGLQILDVINPATPILLGGYDTPGNAYDVTVLGNTAYVADNLSGLQVLDVSNPAAPSLLGNYTTPGNAYGVAVLGSTAYVADRPSGLQVLDVSNPANITLLGSYDTPGSAWSVAVLGNAAYVADDLSGLQVLDVSNPANITLLGSYDTPGNAWSVAVQGSAAYVADWDFGLQVLDVSNLANITLLGSYNTPGFANSVVVQGNMAYVADVTSGLQVLDVSNPATPSLLSSTNTPGLALGVAAQGNTAYVADDASGLQVLDLSQGNLLGTATTALVGQQYSLEVIAYNTLGQAGSSDVFELTVNQLPKRQENTFEDHSLFPGVSLRLEFDSDALFLDPDNNFLTLSLSTNNLATLPSWVVFSLKPTLLGSYDTPGTARGVAVQSNTAYVADDGSGLQVLDVSNPATPTLLGNYDTLGLALDIAVLGSMAYVADLTAGLQVLDVSNPATPILLGSYDTSGLAWSVVVLGSTAYVADDASGLQVLDVSNPAAPFLLGNYDTPGRAFGVVVQDGIAYVADDGSGLQVLDVSNPAAPSLLSNYATPGQAYDVVVQSNTAYVADASGLQMLDVSNPAIPFLLGSYDTPLDAQGVAVLGSTAFVAEGVFGLQVLDMSNCTNPSLLANYDTPGGASGVFLQDHTLYIADESAGLQILDVSQWELTANPTAADVGNYEMVVSATDSLGAIVSDSFLLRVEGPPVFNATLPNQAISVGDAYNYFIPQGIVTDPNNDPITFSAALNNGANLPPWLSFNPFSATFAGTPITAAQYTIKISATDGIAGSTSETFTLDVTHKPQVQQPIIDPLPWRGGREFSFTIPSNAFVDLDGDSLIYSASLNNGVPLPAWLTFDAATGTFSGNPPVDTVTTLSVVVTATDSITGTSAQQEFNLAITANQAPEVDNPVGTQIADVNKHFSFTVPSNVFRDPNRDEMTYTASRIGGKAFPKWLVFSPESRTFSGEPGRSDTGTYSDGVVDVQLTAFDGEKSTSTAFNINVKGASHWELAIKVGAPIISFLSLLAACYGGRAYCLNRINKGKYQKLQQMVEVGDDGAVIPLSADPKKVYKVQAKLLKPAPTNCCTKGLRFFTSSKRPLPGRKLPFWLAYNPNTKQLKVVNGGPTEDDIGELVIQVKDSAGVTLEQFPLNVVAPQSQQTFYATSYAEEGGVNPIFGASEESDEDDFAAVNKGDTGIAMLAV